MKMKKRAVGVLAATFAAAALPIVVASPASADQGDCQYYLHEAGYKVGPKIEAACESGDQFSPTAYGSCLMGLLNIGVRVDHAQSACGLAGA
ncbi:hypothetical protein [Streptomyces sp. WM6372]|uniref:hypothetical protein n=1 Tax=Streptomyces sp. WM6372 TaxID=1415555 RepID=UPI00131B820E|nr:hypothetical protein [Streptomyces sp. WM6372]